MAGSIVLIDKEGIKERKLDISLKPDLLEIPEGMILSYRCSEYSGPPSAEGWFTIGNAIVELRGFHTSPDGSKVSYSVVIEASSVADFKVAWREMCKRLGNPVEDLTPCYIPPSEQSFVRGLKNDLLSFGNFIASFFPAAWKRG